MTHEELVAKAVNHAKKIGIPVDLLQKPKVGEAVVVSFTSEGSSSTAKFYLDAATGDFISGELSGNEFTPRPTGKELSKRAQHVLALASGESKRMNCGQLGSDHLLLGVLASREGAGFAVLSEAGLSLERVRALMIEVGSAPEPAEHGYGPSMRQALRLSSSHADELGQAEIEPEHLLLGLLDEADGPASKIVKQFGLDVQSTKTALIRKLSGKGM